MYIINVNIGELNRRSSLGRRGHTARGKTSSRPGRLVCRGGGGRGQAGSTYTVQYSTVQSSTELAVPGPGVGHKVCAGISGPTLAGGQQGAGEHSAPSEVVTVVCVVRGLPVGAEKVFVTQT